MHQHDLFFEIEGCLLLLEGAMGRQKTEEYMMRELHDPVPDGWVDTLRSNDLLLSPKSALYRKLWSGGMREFDEMAELVLKLFYLRYRVAHFT